MVGNGGRRMEAHQRTNYMSIILDHCLREQIAHDHETFPISLFCNELASLPNHAGPLHWHPYFEIASAECGVLDFQIGLHHVTLQAGESIFINGNILHGIKQIAGEEPDPMPNIVFSGALVAPETSDIYQNYIQPIARCDSLPYIVFQRQAIWHQEVNLLVRDIYRMLQEKPRCYEMSVQRALNSIFELIFTHFEELPRYSATRVQINTQVRIHKMLTYIYEHYKEPISLKEIAAAASISASEAGRCFNAYMGCSPVEALIQHRLQKACALLKDTMLTLQDICWSCGFNSVPYFCRQFRKLYGRTPGQTRTLSK